MQYIWCVLAKSSKHIKNTEEDEEKKEHNFNYAKNKIPHKL